MTIKLLQAFNGLPANTIITLDAATEIALVNALGATFTLAGGAQFVPNIPFNNVKELTLDGRAPASSTAVGTANQYTFDTSYFYLCIATNTWRRILMESF
jgi:hypothetical protein